ncbi:unnamed protein product, partial [Heterotrigona itama]
FKYAKPVFTTWNDGTFHGEKDSYKHVYVRARLTYITECMHGHVNKFSSSYTNNHIRSRDDQIQVEDYFVG